MAADNKLLGQFDLVGIPPAPRGVPQIEVAFDIDANGIVNVSAKDKSTNIENAIVIQSSGGLSKEEVAKMVSNAEEMREADDRKRDSVSAKNDAENLTYTVEKQMTDLKDKISDADKQDLTEKIVKLRTAMANEATELEQLQALTKELQELSWKVTSVAYNQQNAQNEQGKSSDSTGSSGEEKK